jgi:type IV pilus assembly protein PilE
MSRFFATRSRHAAATPPKATAGFTLIETMITLSIAGVLSSVAYPSFQAQIQKARRTEALVAMMKVQLAQERWRGNSAAYGSLAQIGMPATTASGYYTLQISGQDADGYQVLATASGTQAADLACRYMRLSGSGGNLVQASGPEASVANPDAANRRCWNQ